MTNSIVEATGLTMRFRQPKWIGSAAIPGLDNVAPRVTDYSHKIVTNGGFWEASTSMPIDFDEGEDWAVNGLGRHFEVFNPSLTKVWAGFVNSLTLTLGGFSVTIGPMLEIVNYVKADYKTITYNTNPPVRGHPETTAWASDTDSVARYGRLEKIVTLGEMTKTEAEQNRDTFIEENKDPQTSHSIAGDTQESSLSLDLVGYSQLMEKYHPDTTARGYAADSLSDKAEYVLSLEPRGNVFSDDASGITVNATQVKQAETASRSAMKIIKELTAYGTADKQRQTFGVYADELFRLDVLPTEPIYRFGIRDGSRWLYEYSNPQNRVDPWDILPGKMVFIADWIIGKQDPNETKLFTSAVRLRKDPRYMIIESVDYTAPFTFAISGLKKGRPGELLGATGLGGSS